MREILFRGIDKFCNHNNDVKLWRYGSLVICDNGDCEICEKEREGYHVISIGVISETVGQFTGLLDKNGVKIFEGDICNVWRSVSAKGELRGKYIYPMPVVYSADNCQFALEDKPNKILYQIHHFGAVEVIGNIHKSPELLEGIE
jgi:uncharacterized phage protein (TIGR01671 family)